MMHKRVDDRATADYWQLTGLTQWRQVSEVVVTGNIRYPVNESHGGQLRFNDNHCDIGLHVQPWHGMRNHTVLRSTQPCTLRGTVNEYQFSGTPAGTGRIGSGRCLTGTGNLNPFYP